MLHILRGNSLPAATRLMCFSFCKKIDATTKRHFAVQCIRQTLMAEGGSVADLLKKGSSEEELLLAFEKGFANELSCASVRNTARAMYPETRGNGFFIPREANILCAIEEAANDPYRVVAAAGYCSNAAADSRKDAAFVAAYERAQVMQVKLAISIIQNDDSNGILEYAQKVIENVDG